MGMSATVLLLVINYDTTRRTDTCRLPSLPTLPAPCSPVTWTRSSLYKLSPSLSVIHEQRLQGMWLTNNDVISVSIHFRTLANNYIFTYLHMTIGDYKWYGIERA